MSRCDYCKEAFPPEKLMHTPDDPGCAFPGAVLCTMCQLRSLAAVLGGRTAQFRDVLLDLVPDG